MEQGEGQASAGHSLTLAHVRTAALERSQEGHLGSWAELRPAEGLVLCPCLGGPGRYVVEDGKGSDVLEHSGLPELLSPGA